MPRAPSTRYRVLWSMLREHPPRGARAGRARAGRKLAVLRVRGPDVARLRLDGEELKAVELLREPGRCACRRHGRGRSASTSATAQLLAYLLLVTKQVDVLAPSRRASRPPIVAQRLARPPTPLGACRPSAPTQAARPPPTRSRAARPSAPRSPAVARHPRPSARRSLPCRRAVARAGRALEGDLRARVDHRPGRLLQHARPSRGTPRREEIESAFFALAKHWHPDRLPPSSRPSATPARASSRA